METAADGRPAADLFGNPTVTLDGEGPRVERQYTGTAFVVGPKGLLLTNRHVVVPWGHDEVAEALARQGLRPVMLRFVGYLPGRETPFEVVPVGASETADVALLRAEIPGEIPPPLPIRALPAEPGEEIVVLGYPAGIRALLARTDEGFVDSLRAAGTTDLWEVARRLAAAGWIAPLATRGIVGQVTPAAVVYDAETTGGGSGGPVLTLDGEVVAVNMAILPEFGGSNLGVPASEASRLVAASDIRPRP
jgi:S1-C subfamily serine protease